MRKFIYLSFALAAFLFFNSCESTLKDYKPKNDSEKSIQELLVAYVDARNSGDVDTIMSLLHEDCQYATGVGGTFTKSQLAVKNPDWWIEWGKIKLLDSEFKINDNEAVVSSTGKWGVHFKNPHICTLVNEDGKWLITKIKTGN